MASPVRIGLFCLSLITVCQSHVLGASLSVEDAKIEEQVVDNGDKVDGSSNEDGMDWEKLNRTLEDFFKQNSNRQFNGVKKYFQHLSEYLKGQQDVNERQALKQGFFAQLFSGANSQTTTTNQIPTNVSNDPTTTTTTKRPNFITNFISTFTGGQKQEAQPPSSTQSPEPQQPLSTTQGVVHSTTGNVAIKSPIDHQEVVQALQASNLPAEAFVCFNLRKTAENN